MTTERPLTVSESLFVLAGFGPIVVSTTCTGRIDPETLTRAWRHLAHDYPVLRCVIRPDEAGFTLALQNTAPPLTTGADGFPAEATTPLTNGAVSRLTLRETVVSLAVHHALADARLVRTLLNTLLSRYTDLLHGNTTPTTPRPAFEPTMEERLAHFEPLPPQPPTTPVVLNSGSGSGFGVHNLTFDPEATAEIVVTARENGITVNDLLCGAVVTAIPAAEGPREIALCIPVDLRPRLDPPIAPDAQVCAAIPSVVTVHVDTDDEPAEVGRRFGAELRASIDRAEPQRTTPGPPPPMTFMVSNVGVTEDSDDVVDSHFATTLHGPVPGMFVATVRGRLTIDVVHDRAFQSEAQIGEIVASVEKLLRTTCRTAT